MTVQEAINLAVQHHQAGRLGEAEAIYRSVLAKTPEHVEALHLLGVVASQLGKHQAAIDLFRRALRGQPSHVQCRANMGLALAELKRYDDAMVEYRAAIALSPDFVQAHSNLGNALAETGRMDEAIASYQKALRVDPNFAQGRFNLGNVLFRLGRLAEAETQFRRAVALSPNWREAENNLANVLCAQGRSDQAEIIYRQALARRPDDPLANWNLGLSLLRHGNLEQGWEKYEYRLRVPELGLKSLIVDRPRWDGSPLEGKRILIHNEQGIGDTIQFVRYAPAIAERGGKVILRCQAEVRRLLSGFPGIEQIITGSDAIPACDVHCPLPSLPGVFKTPPTGGAYLRSSPELAAMWKGRLGQGKNVGLCWAGRPTHPHDRLRSLRLAAFEPLAKVEGIQFVSLQKGDAATQVAAAPFPIADWTADLADFADTAGLIANLDLIITVDTSVAHLAGAMGKPCWVLIPMAPDWRWMLHREDSPWYQSMRLFRQGSYDDWSTPIAHVAAALPQL